MKSKRMISRVLLVVAVGAAALALGASTGRAVTLPPGNAAQQWDKIAEDTVVGAGAFQGEGFVYLAYVSKAMDGAVNPGQRNGQNADAAVTQAAYDVLVHYFPGAGRRTSSHCTMQRSARLPDGACEAQRDHVRRSRRGQGHPRTRERRTDDPDRHNLAVHATRPGPRCLAD